MSTTRWIIETGCADHDIVERHGSPVGSDRRGSIDCDGGSRLVVDPDNLPPERVERATEAIYQSFTGLDDWEDEKAYNPEHWASTQATAKAAIRAFFSDPEQDLQPTEPTKGKDQPTT